MRHEKFVGLQTPMERIANVAVSAARSAREATTRKSGTISVPNADGTRSILGVQNGNGMSMATHVGDVTPPSVPTGIRAWSGDGSLHVLWDGSLAGDVPADFYHVTILVDGVPVAEMRSAGSVTVDGLAVGSTVSVTATAEDDACLADGTPAHNVSAPSAALSVEIRDAMAEVRADADAHGEQISAIKEDIADYKASAKATYATKTEVDSKTGAITKTLNADYTKTADLASTDAVRDAKSAGTTAQSQLADYKESNDAAVAAAKKSGDDAAAALADYKGVVTETYAEKTELTEAVNQLSSTMTSNYTAFTDYRKTNDTALSKAQTDATNALKEIESVKTTYATKSELKATDTELSGKVSDSLTTAKSYTDSSISTEVTNRNAAIKAQADSINLSVSKTYTKYETFSSYQEDADGRIATANANASTAVSTAKTAASDAATAKTNASTAVSTANGASTSAANAVKTANSASTSASNAVTTANAANTTAQAANTTAQTANATADTAKSTADDAWSRTLRVQVSSTPADAAGDTSRLTATVWRGGEQLSDETVAKMGLLAWYVGGKRVATGSTYTCAAGTATECRLEA
jgi:hypothetical protein